jgi:hypothetical protein
LSFFSPIYYLCGGSSPPAPLHIFLNVAVGSKAVFCTALAMTAMDNKPTFAPQKVMSAHAAIHSIAMDLKDRLRDIETDRRNRLHVWLL